jgi:hypothetical protein
MSVVSLVLAPWFVRVHGLGPEGGTLSLLVETLRSFFG